MKTYRVTVVRMVEGTAIVEAESAEEAKQKARYGGWEHLTNTSTEGVEVVGEPEEVT